MIVFTNTERLDTGILPDDAVFDLELGGESKNTFSAQIGYKDYDQQKHMKGGFIYQPGTEYGGKIRGITETTEYKTITLTGPSFRKMLAEHIIEPPSGQNYLVVSGDIDGCIQKICASFLGDLFIVEASHTGIVCNSHTVRRYISALDALESLLREYGLRLNIRAIDSGELLKVGISAALAVDYSDTVEVSQDSGLNFTIKDAEPEYSHMICLGSGELSQRIVAYLEWNNGTPIECDKIPPGDSISVYKYDYPTASNKNDLLEDGKKKFREVNSGSNQEVTTSKDTDVFEIGDIVGGRSYILRTSLKGRIEEKVVRIEGNNKSISYKIGG